MSLVHGAKANSYSSFLSLLIQVTYSQLCIPPTPRKGLRLAVSLGRDAISVSVSLLITNSPHGQHVPGMGTVPTQQSPMEDTEGIWVWGSP